MRDSASLAVIVTGIVIFMITSPPVV